MQNRAELGEMWAGALSEMNRSMPVKFSIAHAFAA